MSKKSKVQGVASEVVVEGLAETAAEAKILKTNEIAQLERDVKHQEKEIAKLTEFYSKYPHVIEGSVREPTSEDLEIVNQTHGKVCSISCLDCSELIIANVQDAFQKVRCGTCKVTHRQTKAKVKRLEKKNSELAKLSDEEIEAKKAELLARAESLGLKVAA